MDLPKYESLDTRVLGVSVDHIGAQKAFAEKLGLIVTTTPYALDNADAALRDLAADRLTGAAVLVT